VIRDGKVVADGSPMDVIDDEERWVASNLHRTSLIRANLAWRDGSGRFRDAHALARWIVAHDAAGDAAHPAGRRPVPRNGEVGDSSKASEGVVEMSVQVSPASFERKMPLPGPPDTSSCGRRTASQIVA